MRGDPRHNIGSGAPQRAPATVVSLTNYRAQKGMGGSPKPRLLDRGYADACAEVQAAKRQVNKLLRVVSLRLGRSF